MGFFVYKCSVIFYNLPGICVFWVCFKKLKPDFLINGICRLDNLSEFDYD